MRIINLSTNITAQKNNQSNQPAFCANFGKWDKSAKNILGIKGKEWDSFVSSSSFSDRLKKIELKSSPETPVSINIKGTPSNDKLGVSTLNLEAETEDGRIGTKLFFANARKTLKTSRDMENQLLMNIQDAVNKIG